MNSLILFTQGSRVGQLVCYKIEDTRSVGVLQIMGEGVHVQKLNNRNILAKTIYNQQTCYNISSLILVYTMLYVELKFHDDL